MLNKTIILKVYNLLFLSFCIIIPFEENAKAAPNILIIALSFLWIFIIKKQPLIRTVKSKPYILFVSFLIYIALNSLIKGQFNNDLFVLKKFIIPLVAILLAIPIENVKLMKRAFIGSTFIAVIYSLINILFYVYEQEGFIFSLGQMVNELLVSERLYIGLCSVISFVFLIEEFKQSKTKTVKVLTVSIIFIILFFTFLIAARIAIITILFIVVLFIMTQLSNKNKIFATLSLIVFTTLFFSFNQNLTKRFFRADDQYRKTFFDKIAKHEPRFIIWNCSLDIIKNDLNYVFGNGFNTVKDQLVSCYENEIELDHKRDWFVESRFNTHNQFLDLLMSSGIIGLVLFSMMLFYVYKESKKDFYVMALISALLLILLVDNIFHRQIGNYLFTIIFIVTSMKKTDSLKKVN